MCGQNFGLSVLCCRYFLGTAGYLFVLLCPVFFCPTNLATVLKQLEPQQMQMHVLRVKSGVRKSTRKTDRESGDRHRGCQRHFYKSL